MPINKATASIIAIIGAVLTAGGTLFANHTLTAASLINVVVPAIALAVVGKFIDPAAPLNPPHWVMSLVLGLVAAWPLIQQAAAGGTVSPVALVGIIGVVLHQFYQGASLPNRLGFHR